MATGAASNLSAQLTAEKKLSNHPTPEVRWNDILPEIPAKPKWDGRDRRKSTRKHWIVTLLAVAWSLLVTAGAGVAIVKMNDKLEDSCGARQKARTAIRLGFASDPDWTPADQALLDENLPATVIC